MTLPSSIEHTSFTITREFNASPSHVFGFWSDAELKNRWNGCHIDWSVLEDRFEFKVGGSDVKRWRTPEGSEQTFSAYYLDIVPNSRIIYAYEMGFNGERLSASLVTILFEKIAKKARVHFTEQVAILAGGSSAREQRVHGTEEGIDRLVEIIEKFQKLN